MVRTVCRVGAVCLFIQLQARPASAGQDYGMTFSCVESGSDQVCYGSLRAARLAAASSDFAEFRLDGSGYLYFSASWQGSKYDCVFQRDVSQLLGMAALAMDYNAYFAIRMDGQGNCLSNSYLSNSSSYQSLAKP